ncbi:hypothetical protein ZIOFF_031620 [Zingiber officinale]|uniref:BED-type domain-containing protein n=1 Tax=Zingiber officinale TaxID=94328 RepID=A0A8J5GF39_ZINOF|nr:hypothetical protein ZIOFF_031620 [Zingiber officinale]
MSMEESSIPLTINSVIAESNEVNLEINKQIDTAGQETQENAEEKEEEGFQTKKKKNSEVWNDFDTVDGSKKAKCKHCQYLFTLGKSGATSSLLRHRLNCVKRKINLRAAEQQTKLRFLPTDSASPSILTLHSGKFDMEQMREAAAHWIMMHEHPFTILDEEGFNLMMRRGMPEWQKISKTTCRVDCMKIYEIEKKRLKKSLECVDKISLTTDCWKSKTQKIEYMVVTGYWIDSCWNLQKRVLSFINIPPPRGGLQISDVIFKCMKEWGIENRWNSTFEMLSCALKFKEAFKMFKERDPFYGCCPQEEEWDKVQKICSLLEAFWIAIHIISVEFCFPKLYSELDTSKHISKVKEIINSLYEEYVVEETNKGAPHLPESESFGSSSARRSQQNSVYNWDDFDEYCAKLETSETKRSELVDYLEKGRLKKNEIPKNFSCLEWWRMNRIQYPILSKIAADILAIPTRCRLYYVGEYPILSKIAADILAIPVSSVASEATFSVGTRVIDSYRSSLSPDTVQTLLCGGDWLRHIHGLKKKTKLKFIKKFVFQYLPLKKFDMEFWKHMLNKEEDMEIAAKF